MLKLGDGLAESEVRHVPVYEGTDQQNVAYYTDWITCVPAACPCLLVAVGTPLQPCARARFLEPPNLEPNHNASVAANLLASKRDGTILRTRSVKNPRHSCLHYSDKTAKYLK